MGKQRTLAVSPLKGVTRAIGREQQPLSSTWDALNVLPFDRSGRLRVGQRPGIGKLWAAALGSGAPVQAIQQTTIALDPADVTAGTVLFTEPFTYANGNLGTVGAANWQCRDGINQWGAAVNVAAIQVTSNTATPNGANAGCARYIASSLTLGSAHVISATVTIPNTTGEAMLATRIDNAAPVSSASASLGISFALTPPNLRFLINNVVVTQLQIPAGIVTAGTPFQFELHVNGDTLTGYINGTKYITTTSSFNNNKNGVGFTYSAGAGGCVIDNFIVAAGANLASYRQTNIVAVSAGNIYLGDIATQGALVGGGASQLQSTGRIQTAFSQAKMYFVDGFTIKKLDLATKAMVTYAATAGTAPTLCTLAAIWRDRLVLAAPRDNPQNFFLSRVGTHTDWDYSQSDAAAAFAGNASTAGRIGEPIVALVPASDDVLYIMGDHNIWAMRGDPMDGGSIDLISDAIGVLGANAWCKSPDGTIYFVGTGGLYKLIGDGQIENVSLASYPQFFANINRGTSYVTMAWDRDHYGAYVFVSPANTAAATHVWYDSRTDSFWPIQYPDSHGPIAALVYDGDAPADRALLLGGRDGFVRQTSSTLRSDDNATAITSYIVLGPFKPFPEASKLTAATIDFGELATADQGTPARWGVSIIMRCGVDAYSVTEGNAHLTYSLDNGDFQGRSKVYRQRLRGGWFSLVLSNSGVNNYWSMESAALEFEDAGRNRVRR